MRVLLLRVALALELTGCVRRVSPVERGAELAASPAFAHTTNNAFACTTCHAPRPGDMRERILPGAVLAGVTRRPSYWGGAFVDLRDAVDVCYRQFMRGGELDANSEEAIALWAYLDSLASEPGAQTDAVPFTVERTVSAPGIGDALRGAELYARACAYCHGAPHTGEGRLGEAAVLPNDTEAEHTGAMGYTREELPVIFVEKVRHGSFLGLAGSMPPFSREVLPDQDLADIIAYLDPQFREQ